MQYDSSLLDLINKQKELYKNIESLWLDATNAQEQYAAAESKLKVARPVMRWSASNSTWE